MILDNENENLKVHEWISKYNETGELDIVTGYFTIGALAFLAEKTNQQISQYKFILGDIVNFDNQKFKALDLLNEDLCIEKSFQLAALAKEAVAFLDLKKVDLKTLEPNFCHAKLYLKHASIDDRNHYFISGSSNLTEAGVGLKHTSNVELNIAETGKNNQYNQLKDWFTNLWSKPQAHSYKTLRKENGESYKVPFKKYLIDEISRLFQIYTPEQIYFKILFELFNTEQEDVELEKQLIKLENTIIFNKLFDFQQQGVKSLIKMLKKYNGAILADAVGLGKTWSALAVMKSFQDTHEIIVLCPKKLEQNWAQYYKRNHSLFHDDHLDFVLRFHTDLRDGGLERDKISLDYFTNGKKKLIVVDESHNLRNDKSSRYKFLVDEILTKSKGEVKVLLLSATPINNSFKDVRNQFRLMAKGTNKGFSETLEIKNLEASFRKVTNNFNEWRNVQGATIGDFHKKIHDSDFFKLTDSLLVSRTRKQIKTFYQNNLDFPIHRTPINIFKTPLKFGDVENFAELMENLKLNLSAYQPSFYAQTLAERNDKNKNKGAKDAVLKDEAQREFFLVKMMQILMLKRLESSWFAFQSTIHTIYKHHDNALEKINKYQDTKENIEIEIDFTIDEDNSIEELTLGKKNPISLKSIDKAGNLEEFKTAVKADKKSLKYILDNVNEFAEKVKPEKNKKTADTKLQELFKIIIQKQQSTNKKLIIFSAYRDTVEYIYAQLVKHGFSHFAMVAGDENMDWRKNDLTKNHTTILERFAPYTKLFKEKNWADFTPSIDKSDADQYNEWKYWVEENDQTTWDKIQNPLEILITTDVLSEGQNLQDADMVINYDIHWNPVRVIQRLGRIDRIGSPNKEIQSVNFWPTKDIDNYINLKERVNKRMAMMQFAGAEVIDNFTEEFQEIASSQELEDRQNANMIRQMQESVDDIDTDNSIGFDTFSFDNYRQALQAQLNQKREGMDNMPHGIFSGFKLNENTENQSIIALLRNKKTNDYKNSLHLIHIDLQGNVISNNQKVLLELLSQHAKDERFVASDIDSGNKDTLMVLQNAIHLWIQNQVQKTEVDDDGNTKTTAGTATLDLLGGLQAGSKKAVDKLKDTVPVDAKFAKENFDLITWLIVS